MKVKKMNNTSQVFKNGHATWVAMFENPGPFMDALLQMADGYGKGTPVTGYYADDTGHDWLFRQKDPNSDQHTYHALYLTTEEQVTLITLSYNASD